MRTRVISFIIAVLLAAVIVVPRPAFGRVAVRTGVLDTAGPRGGIAVVGDSSMLGSAYEAPSSRGGGRRWRRCSPIAAGGRCGWRPASGSRPARWWPTTPAPTCRCGSPPSVPRASIRGHRGQHGPQRHHRLCGQRRLRGRRHPRFHGHRRLRSRGVVGVADRGAARQCRPPGTRPCRSSPPSAPTSRCGTGRSILVTSGIQISADHTHLPGPPNTALAAH